MSSNLVIMPLKLPLISTEHGVKSPHVIVSFIVKIRILKIKRVELHAQNPSGIGPILLHKNALSYVARMILLKLTKLGYESLPYPPYSPDLSSTTIFPCIWTLFFMPKTISSKGKVETAFKDFLGSKQSFIIPNSNYSGRLYIQNVYH